ncbi:hypothetical protein O6B96_06050 [Campylobacter ureolyticus]|uniref:hypothetical protein n=1 Tax=Campylobacter ureolyticus TaxID=827 RepID=UPI0022B2C559|nr:hypothetical protein [Campylobacter ureolyticus]MCZ6150600.1 hypothetical protein [Campylobacter ureolyticus]
MSIICHTIATTADKSDSIPAKTAIVIDAGIKDLISSKLIPLIFTKVIFKSKLPNLEPIVSAGSVKTEPKALKQPPKLTY